MNNKTQFKINYPIEVITEKLVDFENDIQREEILKRNIYFFNYENEKNQRLDEQSEKLFSLSNKVIEYMHHTKPDLEVINTSIFGSSLYKNNPGDFDFLAITKGKAFDLAEPVVNLNGKDVQIGISIKGVDNFTQGFCAPNLVDKKGNLNQIINRTGVSLYRRHIPLQGKDFLNNDNIFLKNINAQVSDLLHNTFRLFYSENNPRNITSEKRSKKILTRMYEAVSFLAFENPNSQEIDNLRKNIYQEINVPDTSLIKSKQLFDSVNEIYESKVLYTLNSR